MLLTETVEKLNLTSRTEVAGSTEVVFGYASDLLSDVLANAKKGTLWVTNQKHQNIVGVAGMLDLAGVIIAGGIEPDENTLAKGSQENMPLYSTELTLYDTVGRLYNLGIKSCRSGP